MMVARPMGMVPKNIETVEWPKIRRASSKNSTQRAAYSEGKQGEQQNVEQPQTLRPPALQGRNRHRQLRQGQRQHTGAHGRGEPVRGELTDHFARMLQAD